MKLLLAALLLPVAAMLTAAIPHPPSGRTVAMGKVQLWFPAQGRWDFVSDGMRVAIAPAPCDAAHPGEDCTFEHTNNQAIVTVSAPGLAPFSVETDKQASYYHLAVVQLDRRDARPGIVIQNDSGGSAGLVTDYILRPRGHGFERVVLGDGVAGIDKGGLVGNLKDFPRDLSGDGVVDFVMLDDRFSPFGCNACTPQPPRIFTLRGGGSADISRDPAFARLFRVDMAIRRKVRASHQSLRNGSCATYAADAARLGLGKRALENVARWYERNDQWGNGTHFPADLRVFLRRTGYIR